MSADFGSGFKRARKKNVAFFESRRRKLGYFSVSRPVRSVAAAEEAEEPGGYFSFFLFFSLFLSYSLSSSFFLEISNLCFPPTFRRWRSDGVSVLKRRMRISLRDWRWKWRRNVAVAVVVVAVIVAVVIAVVVRAVAGMHHKFEIALLREKTSLQETLAEPALFW